MGPRFPHGTSPWAEGPRDSGLLVALFKAGRPPRPVFNSQWRILIGLRTSLTSPIRALLRIYYLRLLRSTPEGRHYIGVGGAGALAVILGGGWAGSSSLSFFSNRLSS